MTLFDAGYADEPFAELCRTYPGPEAYPPGDFRLEWGPVFHRGRLDGSARVLVVGQDPGAHEAIARRILVGEAGQRIQGFLAKLGIDRSYVMVNAFVYSVYGQGGGERNKENAAIAAYRHRWLDALLVGSDVEAVVTLGRLARGAVEQWKKTPSGAGVEVAVQALIHPTYPESASAHGHKTRAEAMREMLAGWNVSLRALASQIAHPDNERANPVEYGEELRPGDLAAIPEMDMPAGLPEWMRSVEPWAERRGETRDEKRATIVVSIPPEHRRWPV